MLQGRVQRLQPAAHKMHHISQAAVAPDVAALQGEGTVRPQRPITPGAAAAVAQAAAA
jgi:hypothetical protein